MSQSSRGCEGQQISSRSLDVGGPFFYVYVPLIPKALTDFVLAGRLHKPNGPYVGDGYSSTVPGSPQDVSTPRSLRSPNRPTFLGHMPMRNPMLGSPGRPTHMNTPAISGSHPMSSVAYGFRPESGCPGVLFQIFLQGSLVANWQRQKEPMEFWISFEGHGVPAVLHETDSSVLLPDIGTKRYVLQTIVPPQSGRDRRCPITLTVNGPGGRSIVGGLFIGNFQYRPDGIFTAQCSLIARRFSECIRLQRKP